MIPRGNSSSRQRAHSQLSTRRRVTRRSGGMGARSGSTPRRDSAPDLRTAVESQDMPAHGRLSAPPLAPKIRTFTHGEYQHEQHGNGGAQGTRGKLESRGSTMSGGFDSTMPRALRRGWAQLELKTDEEDDELSPNMALNRLGEGDSMFAPRLSDAGYRRGTVPRLEVQEASKPNSRGSAMGNVGELLPRIGVGSRGTTRESNRNQQRGPTEYVYDASQSAYFQGNVRDFYVRKIPGLSEPVVGSGVRTSSRSGAGSRRGGSSTRESRGHTTRSGLAGEDSGTGALLAQNRNMLGAPRATFAETTMARGVGPPLPSKFAAYLSTGDRVSDDRLPRRNFEGLLDSATSYREETDLHQVDKFVARMSSWDAMRRIVGDLEDTKQSEFGNRQQLIVRERYTWGFIQNEFSDGIRRLVDAAVMAKVRNTVNGREQKRADDRRLAREEACRQVAAASVHMYDLFCRRALHISEEEMHGYEFILRDHLEAYWWVERETEMFKFFWLKHRVETQLAEEDGATAKATQSLRKLKVVAKAHDEIFVEELTARWHINNEQHVERGELRECIAKIRHLVIVRKQQDEATLQRYLELYRCGIMIQEDEGRQRQEEFQTTLWSIYKMWRLMLRTLRDKTIRAAVAKVRARMTLLEAEEADSRVDKADVEVRAREHLVYRRGLSEVHAMQLLKIRTDPGIEVSLDLPSPTSRGIRGVPLERQQHIVDKKAKEPARRKPRRDDVMAQSVTSASGLSDSAPQAHHHSTRMVPLLLDRSALWTEGSVRFVRKLLPATTSIGDGPFIPDVPDELSVSRQRNRRRSVQSRGRRGSRSGSKPGSRRVSLVPPLPVASLSAQQSSTLHADTTVLSQNQSSVMLQMTTAAYAPESQETSRSDPPQESQKNSEDAETIYSDEDDAMWDDDDLSSLMSSADMGTSDGLLTSRDSVRNFSKVVVDVAYQPSYDASHDGSQDCEGALEADDFIDDDDEVAEVMEDFEGNTDRDYDVVDRTSVAFFGCGRISVLPDASVSCDDPNFSHVYSASIECDLQYGNEAGDELDFVIDEDSDISPCVGRGDPRSTQSFVCGKVKRPILAERFAEVVRGVVFAPRGYNDNEPLGTLKRFSVSYTVDLGPAPQQDPKTKRSINPPVAALITVRRELFVELHCVAPPLTIPKNTAFRIPLCRAGVTNNETEILSCCDTPLANYLSNDSYAPLRGCTLRVEFLNGFTVGDELRMPFDDSRVDDHSNLTNDSGLGDSVVSKGDSSPIVWMSIADDYAEGTLTTTSLSELKQLLGAVQFRNLKRHAVVAERVIGVTIFDPINPTEARASGTVRVSLFLGADDWILKLVVLPRSTRTYRGHSVLPETSKHLDAVSTAIAPHGMLLNGGEQPATRETVEILWHVASAPSAADVIGLTDPFELRPVLTEVPGAREDHRYFILVRRTPQQCDRNVKADKFEEVGSAVQYRGSMDRPAFLSISTSMKNALELQTLVRATSYRSENVVRAAEVKRFALQILVDANEPQWNIDEIVLQQEPESAMEFSAMGLLDNATLDSPRSPACRRSSVLSDVVTLQVAPPLISLPFGFSGFTYVEFSGSKNIADFEVPLQTSDTAFMDLQGSVVISMASGWTSDDHFELLPHIDGSVVVRRVHKPGSRDIRGVLLSLLGTEVGTWKQEPRRLELAFHCFTDKGKYNWDLRNKSAMTPAMLQTLLKAFAFINVSRNPQQLNKEILVTVDDGTGGLSSVVVPLTIEAINDMTDILLPYKVTDYRLGSKASAGSFRICKEGMLHDPDTFFVKNGYMGFELVLGAAGDNTDHLQLASLAHQENKTLAFRLLAKGNLKALMMGDRQIGWWEVTEPTTRRNYALLIRIIDKDPDSKGVPMEDCARLMREVCYVCTASNPKHGPRHWAMKFNAGDGVLDSRTKIVVNVFPPLIFAPPAACKVSCTSEQRTIQLLSKVSFGPKLDDIMTRSIFKVSIVDGFTRGEDVLRFEYDASIQDIAMSKTGKHFVWRQTRKAFAAIKKASDSIEFVFSAQGQCPYKIAHQLGNMITYENIAGKLKSGEKTVEITFVNYKPDGKVDDDNYCVIKMLVDVSATDLPTEVSLPTHLAPVRCVTGMGPVKLMNTATVYDEDTPVFTAPHTFLKVDIVGGSSEDQITVSTASSYFMEERDAGVTSVCWRGADNVYPTGLAIGTFRRATTTQWIIEFDECPIAAVEDLLKALAYETRGIKGTRHYTRRLAFALRGGPTVDSTKWVVPVEVLRPFTSLPSSSMDVSKPLASVLGPLFPFHKLNVIGSIPAYDYYVVTLQVVGRVDPPLKLDIEPDATVKGLTLAENHRSIAIDDAVVMNVVSPLSSTNLLELKFEKSSAVTPVLLQKVLRSMSIRLRDGASKSVKCALRLTTAIVDNRHSEEESGNDHPMWVEQVSLNLTA